MAQGDSNKEGNGEGQSTRPAEPSKTPAPPTSPVETSEYYNLDDQHSFSGEDLDDEDVIEEDEDTFNSSNLTPRKGKQREPQTLSIQPDNRERIPGLTMVRQPLVKGNQKSMQYLENLILEVNKERAKDHDTLQMLATESARHSLSLNLVDKNMNKLNDNMDLVRGMISDLANQGRNPQPAVSRAGTPQLQTSQAGTPQQPRVSSVSSQQAANFYSSSQMNTAREMQQDFRQGRRPPPPPPPARRTPRLPPIADFGSATRNSPALRALGGNLPSSHISRSIESPIQQPQVHFTAPSPAGTTIQPAANSQAPGWFSYPLNQGNQQHQQPLGADNQPPHQHTSPLNPYAMPSSNQYGNPMSQRIPGQQFQASQAPLGPPPPPRAPPGTIQYRAGTHDSGITGVSGTQKDELKREQIGTFDPDRRDPEDLGLVVAGKDTIYTDVFAFEERVIEFLEDPYGFDRERKLASYLPTLLGGAALRFWSGELDGSERNELRKQGVRAMLKELTERFAMERSEATAKFDGTKLSFYDIYRDPSSLNNYFQKKIRYARAMGTLTAGNGNWQGVFYQIWSHMAIEYQQNIRAPAEFYSVSDYMRHIKRTKPTLIAIAQNTFGKKSSKYDKYPSYSDKYSSRDRDRDSKDKKYDDRRGEYKGRDDRNKKKYDDKRGEYKRDEYKKKNDYQRGREGAHNVVEKRSSRSARSPSSSSRDSSAPDEPDASSSSSSDRDSDHVGSVYVLDDVRRRTCDHCCHQFPFRNALFRHLDCCEGTGVFPSDPANAVQEEDSFCDDDIVGEVTPQATEATAMGGYIHLRINVKPSVKGPDKELCLDPGTGRCLVAHGWVEAFKPDIMKVDRHLWPDRIKGVGGKPIQLKEQATWTFYTVGLKSDGKRGLLEQTATAWLVDDDDLPAGCLLGNEWIHPRKISIEYETCEAVFPQPRSKFRVPFSVVKATAKPVVRKVTAAARLSLSPGETVHIAAKYVDLPKGRSFMFTATHPTAMNALTDAATGKVCQLHNPTEETIKIKKGTRLGTIHECEDSACFVGTFSGVVKALTTATALGATTPVAAPQSTGLDCAGQGSFKPTPEPAFASSPVSSVGAEFDLDDSLRSVAAGVDIDTPMLDFQTSSSSTPYSDAVANFVAASELGDANGLSLDTPPARAPPEVPGSLNIKTPADAPAIVTDDGVHVYAANKKEAYKFQRIVDNHPKTWTDTGPIPMEEDQMMKIPLIDGWQNSKLNCRRYPVSKRDEGCIDEIHDGLQQQGVLEYVDEVCPFALPVFVVWRTVHGQEKGRAVVDLRPLNKWAVPDNYPLPLQSDVLESLRGKKYVTVVDATKFFFHFLVHPAYRDRFTIVSHRGLERSKVALMGFRNSPAHAQRFMDRLLGRHKGYCRAFIDDIVIYSDTFEDHCRHLETIFSLFDEKGISISPSKSYVGYPTVELLGYYVDSLGLSTTKDRTEAFRKLEFPETLKALESYLGATGFLRTMIPYYAQIVEPLQRRKLALFAEGRAQGRLETGNVGKRAAFTTRTRWKPAEDELQAFEKLQHVVCNELRLHHMNPDKKLFLQVDGSLERGFGVMLFHLKDDMKWEAGQTIPSTAIEPVMFLSRCLSRPELNYGPSELEVACLVWACRRLRTVLHSNKHPIVVLTDHDATRGIVNQTSLNTTSTDRGNRRLVNASIYLSQYNLDVHHLAGRLNLVPDALSRLATATDSADRQKPDKPVLDTVFDDDLPSANQVMAEACITDDFRARMERAYAEDSLYQRIVEELQKPSKHDHLDVTLGPNEAVVSASKPGHPFRLKDSLLYNRDNNGRERLVVPESLIPLFLEEAHDAKHHFGRDRMMAELEDVHFRNKRKLVDVYLKKCHRCGEQRQDNQKPIGNMQPIQAPEMPMHTITIDFVTGLPSVSSEGTPWRMPKHTKYDAILTVTDKTSKRCMIIPGHTTYTAEEWATVLGRQLLICDWACPKIIISDRDVKFTSRFWNGLWKSFGTRLMMTTAYHPQSDGQSENRNKQVELALRCYTADIAPDDNWVNVVPSLQWNLNNGYSRVLDASPHEFLFGFKIQSPKDRLTETSPKAAEDIRFLRQHLRRDAQLAMDLSAAESKRRYDAAHRQEEFVVGDKVWLSMGKAYKPLFKQGKMSPKRTGPYTVVRKVTPLAYELDFDRHDVKTRVNNVVSVQYLTRYHCDNDPFERQQPPPPPVTYDSDEDDDNVQNYELDHIVKSKMSRGKEKFLVRWKGYSARHDSWKTEKDLKHSQELLQEYRTRVRSKIPSDPKQRRGARLARN